MKVTYIYNSSFCVELDKSILIFDYANGQLPPIKKDKDVYVFISHRHSDHYTPDVFHFADTIEKIHFIVSDDLLQKKTIKFYINHMIGKKALSLITWVKPNETYRVGQIKVKTLKSTDLGVAFLVNVENQNIYHAGDLNMWAWPTDSEQMNLKAKNDFVDQINKLKGIHIDCAFLTLDPKQENLYAQGFDWFMKHTDTDNVFPMHFRDERKIVDFFLHDPISEPYREKIKYTVDYSYIEPNKKLI